MPRTRPPMVSLVTRDCVNKTAQIFFGDGSCYKYPLGADELTALANSDRKGFLWNRGGMRRPRGGPRPYIRQDGSVFEGCIVFFGTPYVPEPPVPFCAAQHQVDWTKWPIVHQRTEFSDGGLVTYDTTAGEVATGVLHIEFSPLVRLAGVIRGSTMQQNVLPTTCGWQVEFSQSSAEAGTGGVGTFRVDGDQKFIFGTNDESPGSGTFETGDACANQSVFDWEVEVGSYDESPGTFFDMTVRLKNGSF